MNSKDTLFIPGFVNAHCHLDLSHMAGQFSYKGSFSGWIREVMARRLEPDADAIRAAAQALTRSGVTTVYDHVGTWSDVSPVIDVPLRYRFFVEVSGVAHETAESRLAMAQGLAIQLQREGYDATPTPHSLYSLHQDTLNALLVHLVHSAPSLSHLKSEGYNFSIHYAESAEEREYFASGTGKMAEFLAELGACHPLESLRPNLVRPRNDKGWLAVHCNTVTDADIIALKATNATVVHCPRSHRYFNHPPFPLEKIRAAGIPIMIGTDSLASCPNFDFLEELRAFREEFPFLTTEEILGMATGGRYHSGWHRGAVSERAMRASGTPPGDRTRCDPSPDDIIGLPIQDDILQGPVTFSMIGGKRVI